MVVPLSLDQIVEPRMLPKLQHNATFEWMTLTSFLVRMPTDMAHLLQIKGLRRGGRYSDEAILAGG